MKKPIIIDTDPGIDDALALACALFSNKYDILLVTTMAGNVNLENTTRNTLDLISYFGYDVDVAKGSEYPLLGDLSDASYVHGKSGIGSIVLPKSLKSVIELSAVNAMRKAILASEKPVTIISLAALTNIALLLKMYPEVKNNIEEIVMMGGGIGLGNVSSCAEFNFYVDPLAADLVFNTNVSLVMVGLNATNNALLTNNELAPLLKGSKIQKMFYQMFSEYQDGNFDDGISMHDVCTIFYLEHPEFFNVEKLDVKIVKDGFAKGATVVDYHPSIINKPYVDVCMGLDTKEFAKWCSNLLKIM
ncbi:nucleoside hydrolase [Mycoplasma sp. P36-A1]|uniref:nucleoside hydrolase n=1 Tax=Mycoplasma sp. P36-A1 TaxID=3252900 RepID=UPI003C2D3356